MRLTGLRAQGILAFEDLDLSLDRRVTVLVGPNGVGKTNVLRLIELAVAGVVCSAQTDEIHRGVLDAFLQARRRREEPMEVRLDIELTTSNEREALALYMRGAAISGVIGNYMVRDMGPFDEWASHIDQALVDPLCRGTIFVGHSGRQDQDWDVEYEFAVAGERLRWGLLGRHQDSIVRLEDRGRETSGGVPLGSLLGGLSQGAPTPPSGNFTPECLVPTSGSAVTCPVEVRTLDSAVLRKLLDYCGYSTESTPSRSYLSFAAALRVVLAPAITRADTLPPLVGRSDPTRATVRPAASLPGLLGKLRLGSPNETQRLEQIKGLFQELTRGRSFEVRRLSNEDEPDVYVTVTENQAVGDTSEVPIAFAGTGASQALVIAVALTEGFPSVTLLDEPGVGLHPSLQRGLAAHLNDTEGQMILTTHTAELLPPSDQGIGVIRLGRDRDQGATRAWLVEGEVVETAMRRLRAKGNERLLFSRSAILCEGETDVAAVQRLVIQRGWAAGDVTLVDCGGRDSLPAHIVLCGQLGIPCFVLYDQDLSKLDRDPSLARKTEAIRSAATSVGAPIYGFSEDLEEALGIEEKSVAAAQDAVDLALASGQLPLEIADLAALLEAFLDPAA